MGRCGPHLPKPVMTQLEACGNKLYLDIKPTACLTEGLSYAGWASLPAASHSFTGQILLLQQLPRSATTVPEMRQRQPGEMMKISGGG